MNTITFRQLQRLTVNEMRAKLPCVVLVDSQPVFNITAIDSQGGQIDSQGYFDNRQDVIDAAKRFNQGIKAQGGMPDDK